MKMQRGNISKIADKTGVSRQFLSRVLSGARRPSYEVSVRLAKATGTSPLLWLGGTRPDMAQAIINTCRMRVSNEEYEDDDLTF